MDKMYMMDYHNNSTLHLSELPRLPKTSVISLTNSDLCGYPAMPRNDTSIPRPSIVPIRVLLPFLAPILFNILGARR